MKLCRNCFFLSGCDLVETDIDRADSSLLDPDKLITEKNYRECQQWLPISSKTEWVRLLNYERFGLQALEAVYMLPRPPNPEEETITMDTSQFIQVLKRGVTYKEREDQLRYETLDDGELQLTEKGEKIPRSQFDLRRYITDKEGPVGLDARIISNKDWNTKKLVDTILAAEKEKGWLLTPDAKRALAGNVAQKKGRPMANVSVVKTKTVQIRGGGAPAAQAAAAPATAARATVAVRRPGATSATPAKARTAAEPAGVAKSPATARRVNRQPSPPPEELPEAQETVEEQQGEEQTEHVLEGAAFDYDVLTNRLAADLQPVISAIVEGAEQRILESISNQIIEKVLGPKGLEADAKPLAYWFDVLHDLTCLYLNGDNTVIDKDKTILDLVGETEPDSGNG